MLLLNKLSCQGHRIFNSTSCIGAYTKAQCQPGELVSCADVLSLSGSWCWWGPTGVDGSALPLPSRHLPSLPCWPGEQCGTVQQQHSGTNLAHGHYIYFTQQSCTVAPTSKQRYQKMAMGMMVCINICCTYKLSNTIKCINIVCSFFVSHRSLQSPCLWCLHETSDHNCPVIYLKRCCDNKSVFYKIKCVCVLHCLFFWVVQICSQITVLNSPKSLILFLFGSAFETGIGCIVR